MNKTASLYPPVTISLSVPKVNKRIILLAFLIFALALSIFYIFQINSLVATRSRVESYQGSIKNLTQENEKLEASLAGADSLQRVESMIAGQQFVKTGQIDYIQTPQTSVVLAK